MKQWSLALFGSEGPLYIAPQMELKMRSINDNGGDEEVGGGVFRMQLPVIQPPIWRRFQFW